MGRQIRAPQLHEGLIEIPGGTGRDQPVRQFPQAMKRGGLVDPLFDREQPGEHALDVAIQHRRFHAEGDAGDGPRRVAPDTGQLSQFLHGTGKNTLVMPGDRLGGFV